MADAQAMTIPATPSVSWTDEIAVLSLGSGEGRFDLDSVAAIGACLDEVLSSGAKAMVTTAESKIWSNGFNIDWLCANPEQAGETIRLTEVLLARVLTFPIPTVAAIGGHCFAGGLFLAMAHDGRVMRADRGFLCLPEADMGVVFTPGMFALLQSTIPIPVAHKAMILAQRLSAADALRGGMIDEAVEHERVVPRALELAQALGGKDRKTLAELKTTFYAQAVATLGAEPPTREMLLDLGVKVP
jgi:enoyl-CoA hydratase/carnithine racemase